MQRTHKSIIKRLKITGGGKVLHRTCGQNHFNSRESGKTTKNKRKNKQLSKNFRKTIKQII